MAFVWRMVEAAGVVVEDEVVGDEIRTIAITRKVIDSDSGG